MADTAVAKRPDRESDEQSRWLESEPALFRMNPFALMRQFAEQMDRTFGGQTSHGGGEWSPAIEVKVKEGKFVVTAELPGVKKEDVKVHITDGTLTLKGERKEEKEEQRKGYYHSERSYGSFFRSIPLPKTAKTEQVVAHFKDGVLEITVPVPEAKENSQQVPIQ